MNPTSKIKNIIALLVAAQKTKINTKIGSIKHKFIVERVIPYLTAYVREVIIANGLNPDKVPGPKPKTLNDYISDTLTLLPALLKNHGIEPTRGKSTSFNFFVPKWVSESFRDPSKHPLYKVPMKKEVIEELQVTLPTDTLSNAINNFKDSMSDIIGTMLEDSKNEEVQPDKKPAAKKPATKKPATKKPATKNPATKKQPIKVSVERDWNGSFRRVAHKE